MKDFFRKEIEILSGPDPRYGFQTKNAFDICIIIFCRRFLTNQRKCHPTYSSCFQVVQLPPLPCTT